MLMETAERYNFLDKFSISRRQWLEKHIKMYLDPLRPCSKINIVKCAKYKRENCEGVKTIAAIDLKEKEVLNCLKGVCTTLSADEQESLRSQKLDFSVIFSQRTKKSRLFLGPAAFVNHDCSPNCMYQSTDTSQLLIITLHEIKKGEELFCFYGTNYFGQDNQECECDTCYKNRKGIFSSHNLGKLINIF